MKNAIPILTAFVIACSIHGARSQEPAEVSRAQRLRGEYGRYRANNDLTYYHLDVRVDPEQRSIRGRNQIQFRMLANDDKIQIDLSEKLAVEKIVWKDQELKYEREGNAVFVEFPETLASGQDQTIDFYYSGHPVESGRFGGMTFGQDRQGRPWIYTACEGQGASVWWPNKDQWRDEAESMDISVAVPNELSNISNGRFKGKTDLGDGYTRWDYHVHYPINSYNVSVNAGSYEHFSDTLGDLSLDYYVLPESIADARRQFTQVKPMLEAFQHYFGDYPFPLDGYKLIQVPYSGMEHQSAVTYGNGFKNGYQNRDWTGVGVSMKFDFIIIHESGHEWWGNAVSAADVSDMWIHEGWTTYMECLYVEHVFGYDDALKYVNGYKSKVRNREPIITERGWHRTPPQDMYFKGALFLHTLRNVLNNDDQWWKLMRDAFQKFKYHNIMTEDLIPLFNERFGRDMTAIFDQYLRHEKLPVLELEFDDTQGTCRYRWQADVTGFAMPIRVGSPSQWQVITPTTEWQSMPTTLPKADFGVATDLYYVDVSKR